MITGVHEAVSETVSDVVSDAVSDVHEAVRKAHSRREQLREQTDHKIMKATLAIVISDGVGAVTIEEVARRSGVAKPRFTVAIRMRTICCAACSWKLRDCRISAMSSCRKTVC